MPRNRTPVPAGMSWLRSRSHRDWLASETTRLLEFARGARVEDGFGYLDANGAPDADRARELWITTRMTHVFALGELLGHPAAARWWTMGSPRSARSPT